MSNFASVNNQGSAGHLHGKPRVVFEDRAFAPGSPVIENKTLPSKDARLQRSTPKGKRESTVDTVADLQTTLAANIMGALFLASCLYDVFTVGAQKKESDS